MLFKREARHTTLFVSLNGDDETHAATRVEASSFLLFPRLPGPKNWRSSRFALCCTSPTLMTANQTNENLNGRFPSSSTKSLACMG